MLKRILIIVLTLTGCLLWAAPCLAATYLVNPDGSGDYATIQAAINASSSGDVIELGDGIFTGPGNRDLDYGGRGITVRSQSHDPDNCIIDCTFDGRGFHFHSGEGSSSVLQWVTITRGFGTWEGTQAGDAYGGGILIYNSSPVIRDCVIKQCVTEYYNGGGIGINSGSALIADNTIADNDASHKGGGIYVAGDGNPRISGNTIIRNRANNDGGGITAISSNVVIASNSIAQNYASHGGGIFCYGDPTIINNIIVDNEGGNTSGGIGMYNYASPIISSNTIAGNRAGLSGGGIGTDDYSDPIITDTIVWGNEAAVGSQIWIDTYCNVTIDYSDVDGGQDDVYLGGSSTLNWGLNMLDSDPYFAPGPQGSYYLAQVAAGQTGTSPCVDAGSASAGSICFATVDGTVCLDDLPTRTDLVNDSGTVDIGAHPVAYTPFVYLVLYDGSGDFPTIQAAVNATQAGDVVELGDGIFTGSGNRDVDYGGKAITVRSRSGDPEACIINCQGSAGSPHRGFIFQSGERYGAVLEGVSIINGYAAGAWPAQSGGGIQCNNASMPTLSNLIVRDCQAEYGGGIYLTSSGHARIEGCVVTDNTADQGAGIVCYQSSPHISNCTLQGNDADFGAAMSILTYSDPHIENTIIAFNVNGSVIDCSLSDPDFDCTDIYGNPGGDWISCYAGQLGFDGNINVDPQFCSAGTGDLHLEDTSPCAAANNPSCGQIGALPVGCGSGPTTYLVRPDGSGDFPAIQPAIDACNNGDTVELADGTFTGSDNRNLDLQGKAITVRSQSGDPTACIIDCEGSGRGFIFQSGEGSTSVVQGVTIFEGFAPDGAGIRCETGTFPTITNCIFDHCTTNDQGGGIFCLTASPIITDCIFNLNWGVIGGGGIKCHLNSSPTITGCTFLNNVTESNGAAIALEAGSHPQIEGCTFYGNLVVGGGTGGGIRCHNSSPVVTNCIISFSAGGDAVSCGGNSNPVIACTDIYGNVGGDWTGCIAGFAGIDGNIATDPLFCDAENGDLTLQDDSPCAEGNSPCDRIGAYGVGCVGSPTYLLVRADGSGDQPTIQAAIDVIADGGVIELADGTYTGTGNRDLETRGKPLTVRSQSGDPTTVSIDAQGSTGDQHRCFFIHEGEGPTTVIESITITGGYYFDGGGMACSSGSSPTLNDLIFSNNTTTDDGGALFCIGNSEVVITGCVFSTNHADDTGGGVHLNDSDAQISASLFELNTCDDDGGGLVAHNGTVATVTDCLFRENTATDNGGGAYCGTNSPSEFLRCTFVDNTADHWGGGLSCYISSPSVTYSTFHGNAAVNGAAIDGHIDAHPILGNTLIAFNDDGAGDPVYCSSASDLTITCSDVFGHTGGDWTGCLEGLLGVDGNISEDPLFCDAEGGDFTLQADSPCAEANSPCGQIGTYDVGCAAAPDIAVTPGSLEFNVAQDGGDWDYLEIANGGGGDLNWYLGESGGMLRMPSGEQRPVTVRRVKDKAPDAPAKLTVPLRGKPEAPGSSPDRGAGGSDSFGYSWIDSDEAGGPVFDWVDITGTGTEIILSLDDFEEVPLPFPFPFYGDLESSIKICSHGYLTFGSDGTDFSNDPIPEPMEPNDLIAIFWDDVSSVGGTGTVHYLAENDRFVVQYTELIPYGGGSPLTFEAILYPNGEILFQYLDMQGTLTTASVGIENETGVDGLEIVHNASYIHDGLAVRIGDSCPWLTTDPGSGSVPESGGAILNVYVDSEGLAPDTYSCDLLIHSNDPDEPTVTVPVTLTVSGEVVLTVNPDGSGDYPTIQAAIDAALPGGVVELTDGYFTGPGNRDLGFGGKELTLRSQSGNASACVIDCQGSEGEPHRGLYINGGQDHDTVVERITFYGAWQTNGGGLRISNDSDPVIDGCIFMNCSSSNGGGIFVTTGSNPTITGCRFEGNSVTNAGGGIRFSGSSGDVIDCAFIDNYGYWGGAGIYIYQSHATVEGCLFSGNDCNAFGTTLEIHEETETSTFSNCTIYGGSGASGTVYVRAGAAPVFDHCIFAFAEDVAAFESNSGGTATLECCDIYGNAGGDWVGFIADQLGVNGNISADPVFCNPGDEVFTLDVNSPCSGANSPCGQIGAFDVGCYQIPTEDVIGFYADTAGTEDWIHLTPYQSITLYLIIKSPSSSEDIAGWECSLPVPPGLILTNVVIHGGGLNVGIAPNYVVGLAYPLPSAETVVLADFTFFISLGAPQELFIGPAVPSSIDPPAPMYLAGDAPYEYIPLTPSSGSEDLPVFRLNPLHHTYTVNPDGSGDFPDIRSAIIACYDADTILLGDGTFTGPSNRNLDTMGKEIEIRSASRGAESCIIDCQGQGRAFHIHQNEGPETVIEAITVINGYAESLGGAILLGTYGESGASPTIRDCIFRDNASGYGGGALDVWYSSDPLVTGCLFHGNTTVTYGGGASVDFGSGPHFESCTFYGNTCTESGGGDGGGLWISSQPASAANCIFWENSAAMGDQIGLQNGATIDLTCSDVMGGQTGINIEGGCTLNWDEDNIWDNPLFCNAYEGEFTLASASPCLPGNNDCGELMGAYGEGCTAVDTPEDLIPRAHYLAQNSPNPFNPTTEIRFGLPTAGSTTLRIYDVSGRCVRNLIDRQTLPAGHHRTLWDGRNDRRRQLASGVYFYRLEAGRYSQTQKMVLLK